MISTSSCASIGLRCLMAAAATLTLTQCTDTVLTDVGLKSGAVSVTTYHYDNTRSGIQSHETVLTPANVNATSFGKLASLPVDGQVYANPLVIANVILSQDKLAHTLVFIATQHDTVYAFDADSLSTTPVWQTSLLQPGETPVIDAETVGYDITPEIGVTGTPVIDANRDVLYVVSKSRLESNGQVSYAQRLHALSLQTGQEIMNGPATIAPSVPGTAADAVNGMVHFNPLRENQRSALALVNGTVWIAWASHQDVQPYHGWLVGYDGGDLSKTPSAFVDTPNGSEGGIWMAGNGPSADANGNLYVSSGNGDFDASANNYSSSTLRLSTDAAGMLQVRDSFTPSNQAALSVVDADYGVMGALLLPDQPGAHPHLLATAAKDGTLYLLDRDNLGGYNKSGPLQSFQAASRLHQNPIFFNNLLYVGGDRSPLTAYPFDASTSSFATTPISSTPQIFGCTGSPCYVSGSAPSISLNAAIGNQSAILWANDTLNNTIGGPGILRAYDAGDLSHELYDNTQAANNRDQGLGAIKFTTPVVANGQVYVSGAGGVDVYGLLTK